MVVSCSPSNSACAFEQHDHIVLCSSTSFGGGDENSTDIDFDIEWAGYTLPGAEQIRAEGGIRNAPYGTSLAGAHTTTRGGGSTGMDGTQQVVTPV